MYADVTPMTLRVELPELPLCQRWRPLTLALNPSSAEMLRRGRRELDQLADAMRAG